MSDHNSEMHRAHSAQEYDRQWAQLDDFIKYNPGARHRRRLMLDVIKDIPFSSVLDVGCGPAKGLVALYKRFPQLESLHGIDFAPDVVQNNQALMPQFRFSHADITQEAIAETFDLVVCSEVIEHLEAREAAFLHLSQMVKAGGFLLITCPMGPLYATERNWGHVSHPNRQELQALGAAVGLREIRCIEWGFPSYRLLKWAVNVDADWSLRKFGSGPYGFWKKRLNDFLYYATFANLKFPGHGCQLLMLLQKDR